MSDDRPLPDVQPFKIVQWGERHEHGAHSHNVEIELEDGLVLGLFVHVCPDCTSADTWFTAAPIRDTGPLDADRPKRLRNRLQIVVTDDEGNKQFPVMEDVTTTWLIQSKRDT